MLALGSAKIIQIRKNEFLFLQAAHRSHSCCCWAKTSASLENVEIALDAIKCKISKKL